jgi:AcrR family transcriptional regulator
MARRAGSTGAETAEKLRNAALELFARSGYAAVSMREIAAETGVQAGAIYNHFPTKQDLLNELLQVHMETLALHLGGGGGAGPATTAGARTLSSGSTSAIIWTGHVRCSSPTWSCATSKRRTSAPSRGCGADMRACRAPFSTVVLPTGLFDIIDPQVTTMAIIAMLNGMTTWYRESGRLSLDEIEALYVRLVARLVGQRRKTDVFTTSMNFGLGEEIDALRDTVSRFARDRVAPVAEETDRDNQFPMHLWKEMGAWACSA